MKQNFTIGQARIPASSVLVCQTLEKFSKTGPLTDDPALMNDWSDDETDNPLRADDRDYYKVEK